MLPEGNQPRTAAGRRWLRAYINGCGFKVFDATLPLHLADVPFCNVVEWLYRTSGFVLIGARHTMLLTKRIDLLPMEMPLPHGCA